MKAIFLLSLLVCFLASTTRASNEQLQNLIGTTVNFACSDQNISYIAQICQLVHLANSSNFLATVQSAQSLDYLLNTTFPSFNGSDFIQNYLPPQLQSLAHTLKLDTLYLDQPYVYINLGQTQAARFSGTVSFANVNGVFLDVALSRTVPISAFFIVTMPFVSINSLLSNVFPVNFNPFFDIFSGNSNFSLEATTGFDFAPIPELKPASLPDVLATWNSPFIGLSARLKVSEKDNNISNFLRKYLGPDAVYLFNLSIDTTGFYGFVGLPAAQILPNLTLTNFGVTVKVQMTNPQPQLSFGGQVTLTVGDYPLQLWGSLTFSPLGADFALGMNGLWSKPFGLDRLTFGNLAIGAGITWNGVPKEIIGSGEIAYGADCYVGTTFVGYGFCLFANGVVGIDVTNTANNYFKGNVSKLDLDTILRAVLGSQDTQPVVIPPVITTAVGFPQGLGTSYSLVANKVKSGYFLEGAAQLFNMSASISIKLDTVLKTFSGYAEVSPINFGDVFTFIGTSSKMGPFVNISAALFPPAFSFQMSAIVTVLGITKSVNVNFDLTRMFFPIQGALHKGVLLTNLGVELKYDSFNDFNFNVTGMVQMNQQLLNLIQNITGNLTIQLQNAKAKVTSSQADVAQAQATVAAKAASICGGDINTYCSKKSCSNIFCTFVSWIVDKTCVAACNASQLALSVATGVLNGYQKTLTATLTVLGGLSKASDFISNNVVTVFNIVDASFSMTLNAANKNSFDAGILVDVDLIVLGTTYKRQLLWNFTSVDAIQQVLVNEALAIIKSKFTS